LLTFLVTMTPRFRAPPDGRSTPPQLTLILCGITGPVSGNKKSGVTTRTRMRMRIRDPRPRELFAPEPLSQRSRSVR
jgi:hypothetical protein